MDKKPYLHPDTGIVSMFTERAAEQFPFLVPAEDDLPCLDCMKSVPVEEPEPTTDDFEEDEADV